MHRALALNALAPTLAVLALAACRASGSAPHATTASPTPAAPLQGSEGASQAPDLRADWLALSPQAFAALTAEFAAARAAAPLGAGTRATLSDSLAAPGEPAVRAAVLLAHAAAAGDEDAREALLARLERRAHAPSRSEAGGDVTAAAALALHASDKGVAARLAALATGERAHPELDVRVECARGALAGGDDAVAPFLLAVLRAETPDEARAPRDWPRTTSLFWAKARAADALAARAGARCEFRPDASWADQMAAADALEAAVRGAGALR